MPKSYNKDAIRDLLLDSFDDTELQVLIGNEKTGALRPCSRELALSDSYEEKVRKIVSCCDSNHLFPKLLAEVKEENPWGYDKYSRRIVDPHSSRQRPQGGARDEQSASVEISLIGNPSYVMSKARYFLPYYLDIPRRKIAITIVHKRGYRMHVSLPPAAAEALIQGYQAGDEPLLAFFPPNVAQYIRPTGSLVARTEPDKSSSLMTLEDIEVTITREEGQLKDAEEDGDPDRQVRALALLCFAYTQRDDLGSAIHCQEQLIDIAKEKEDMQTVGRATSYLGVLLAAAREFSRALEVWDEAYHLLSMLNDHPGLEELGRLQANWQSRVPPLARSAKRSAGAIDDESGISEGLARASEASGVASQEVKGVHEVSTLEGVHEVSTLEGVHEVPTVEGVTPSGEYSKATHEDWYKVAPGDRLGKKDRRRKRK